MKSNLKSAFGNEAMFKLIIVGDSGTGKSSLLVRYVKDIFNEQYSVTVGIEFASKTLKIDDNYKVKLQLWDTAGQQSFRSIVKTFYNKSSAVVLVYDITKKKTFENLVNWIHEAKQNAPKDALFILIGSHLDLEKQRQVSQYEAKEWVNQQQINMFFETSSKTSANVALAFDEIAKQLFSIQLQKQKQKDNLATKNVINNLQQINLKTKSSENKCC